MLLLIKPQSIKLLKFNQQITMVPALFSQFDLILHSTVNLLPEASYPMVTAEQIKQVLKKESEDPNLS